MMANEVFSSFSRFVYSTWNRSITLELWGFC